jgi:pimeloyl-ACP methyl ester carboxylesterase
VADFHVTRLGTGPRLLLVHGSVWNSVTWRPQHALAERYELVIPDRPGYPPNPPLESIDFEQQAGELEALLDGGAHVLGFSYGGVISLLLAALASERVRSLAVIEPPAFGVARGQPAVEATVTEMSALWDSPPAGAGEFLRRFAAAFGEHGQVPPEVPPEREQGVYALVAERRPWEARIPLSALRRARFPKLVFSGDHHPAFEAVSDALERGLGAERAVLSAAGHAVHHAPGFNERYAEFLRRAAP